ncbi:MAG: AMP-binding protein, partial [Verrucomicrobia bacterium]|nr:AMP-binding protein [Verrucomicrobiota bacterium]
MGIVSNTSVDDEVLQELGAFEEARRFIDEHGAGLIDSIALRSEAMAKKFSERPAVFFEGQQLSWEELNTYANRFAHAMQECGVESGHVVALMMENRVEFLACFIAISKLGAICSLINTNLVGEGLGHSCSVSNVRWLVFGEELDNVVAGCRNMPDVRAVDFFRVDDLRKESCPDWATDLSERANKASCENPHCEPLAPRSLIFYIFTSGTTGLPKAVKITNRRYLGGAIAGWKMSLRSCETDRQYMALPLYHGVGI